MNGLIRLDRFTEIAIFWLRHNGYITSWKPASVIELKRLVTAKLGTLNEDHKKGLRQVDWEQIYKLFYV